MNKIAITSGTTFVLAWITGLLVAGNGPKPTAGAAAVTSYCTACSPRSTTRTPSRSP